MRISTFLTLLGLLFGLFLIFFSACASGSCYSPSSTLEKSDAPTCSFPGANEEHVKSTESASNGNTNTSSLSIISSIGFWGTVWGICLTIYCFIKWHLMEAPGWGRNAAWFMSGAAIMKTFSCFRKTREENEDDNGGSGSSKGGCCLAQSSRVRQGGSIENASISKSNRSISRGYRLRPTRRQQHYYSDDDYV